MACAFGIGRVPKEARPFGYVFVAALLLVGAACTAQNQGSPSGRTGLSIEERYPPDRYLVGRGCVALSDSPSEDQASADRVARAEVAKQIEVKVVQFVKDVQREEMRNTAISSSHTISVATEEVVENTLKGVQILSRYTDDVEGVACAYAVLDKVATARRVGDELEGRIREIERYISLAEAEKAGGRMVEAVRGYTYAQLSMDRLAVGTKLLVDLGYHPPQAPSYAEVWGKWIGLVRDIRLRVQAGDRQRGKTGSPLAEPLIVQALDAQGRPVSGLPVKILRAPEGCSYQAEAETDARGEAGFRVYRAVATGKALEEISVGIDWQRLLRKPGADVETVLPEGREPWKGWDTREAVFVYRVPVPGDYRVGVAMYEYGTGRPLNTSPVHHAVLEGLQAEGFRTRDLFSLTGDAAALFAKKPELDRARARMAQELDLIVIGEVSLKFSSRTNEGFIFYRARGILQGISVDDGRILATLDMEAKGGGLDEDRAVRKALGGLATRLGKEIGPRMEELLE